MNNLQTNVDQLIYDIKNYLKFQQEVFGDEIYSSYKKPEIAQSTPLTKEQKLLEMALQVKDCNKCQLSQTRQNIVFGAGNPDADIMIIGEAPGYDEDRQGKPFVGAAGQLLTKILAAINLSRDEVFITNILKCRPPNNRDPLPPEQQTCKPILLQQIEIIAPKLILLLGRIAVQALFNTTESIQKLRGKIYKFQNAKLVITYHPAALLRNSGLKRATWEDVQILQKLYLQLKSQ